MATTNNQCLTINLRGSSPVTDGELFLGLSGSLFAAQSDHTESSQRTEQRDWCFGRISTFSTAKSSALLPSWARVLGCGWPTLPELMQRFVQRSETIRITDHICSR